MLGYISDTRMWRQLLALKLGYQKMLSEQDEFSKVSDKSPDLFFATESASVFFRLS